MTILARSWQPPFAGSSHSRRRAGFIPGPASAGRASRTGPQSHRRAQQQRPIRDHQRPSALSDPAKTIPRQSRGSVKSPIDRQALIAFPRVRSSEAFRRRPPIPGSIAGAGPASETLTEKPPFAARKKSATRVQVFGPLARKRRRVCAIYVGRLPFRLPLRLQLAFELV